MFGNNEARGLMIMPSKNVSMGLQPRKNLQAVLYVL